MKKRYFCLLLVFVLMFSMFQGVFADTPIKVILDNKVVKYKQNPIIVKGVPLVPLRETFTALNASFKVEWDQKTKGVKLSHTEFPGYLFLQENNLYIKFYTEDTNKDGSFKYTKDGKLTYHVAATMKLKSIAPQSVKGTLMIPLEIIELYDYLTEWKSKTKVIDIATLSPNSQEDTTAGGPQDDDASAIGADNYAGLDTNSSSATDNSLPYDEKGNLIQLGDKVRITVIYGEVVNVSGSKILVNWSGNGIYTYSDVAGIADFLHIKFGELQWVEAKTVIKY